ncbi:uncharacterized protein LOC107371326 [Tetranychus urticae]|uniref:uncharacterized protein LOC107371326 n=1 Tax=Tetranychus urticae TaxID=32264 RepID=UPI00077B8651|nr:uncharacterized protein LOC107371326 [Tetranychus urticae]
MDYLIASKLYTILVLLLTINGYNCTCYFPIEYQGTFMMQTQASSSSSSSSNEVTYSEITIEADAISPWGSCHERNGTNVILTDSTGPDTNCMRCLHLSLKTGNILQIHAEGLARCYTNVEAAKATCPTDKTLKENRSTLELILFRKHIPVENIETIEKVFCPINGRYKLTYTTNNGQDQCTSSPSDISNCPKGNVLSARFRKCQSIPDQEIQFQCLGDWENTNGGSDRFIALLDLSSEPRNRPKYRCGMFRENSTNGQIYVSLSADSTCSTNLVNARIGYETLTLTPTIGDKIMTRYPITESIKCRFPDWTQGKWDRSRIDGNQFKFKDVVNNYRTLTSKCIMRQSNTPNDRFIVHSSTQCYTLEFQFGAKSSPNLLAHLCDDQHFTSNNWITQGRKIVTIQTPCPITGDYTGIVPNVTGLCAKVSSDCNNPDIMYHSVSSCENASHVFEEREYRCLGNWEEDGILYTFTQRRDATGYQCFAGKILGNGEVAYIREAGENCIRAEHPLTVGMKITKQVACQRIITTTKAPWPLRTDRIYQVHKAQPSFQPALRTVSTKPIAQPLPHHIPRPIQSMLGFNDNNPHWYQSDPPAKKIWKPASITPFKQSKMHRSSGSSICPIILLTIAFAFLSSLVR